MEGFIGAIGEPLFLWLFDTADNMAIDTIWQNLGLLPKGLVLSNCMGFAEKNTRYGEVFPAAVKGSYAVIVTENKPPVFM